MKLQPDSRREIKRITLGTLACDGIMVAGLFLLSQFDMGTFDLKKILLGALCGSAIAVLNFTILCLTIQAAVGIQSQRKMRAKFQLSYNVRLAIQAIWIVGAFFLRHRIHFVAAAAPIFFPKFTLLYLQFKGKLLPPDPPRQNQDAAGEETHESPEEP